MRITPPNSDLSEEERHLRIDINKGIELALDKELPDRNREITGIEQEKITYFISKDLDYDLTYSWYLAGACQSINSDSNDYERDSSSEPSPKSYGDLQKSHVEPRVNEIKNYLIDEEFFSGYDLKKIWYTPKSKFLSDFYEECAPDRYKDLYLASQSVRDHLGKVDDFVSDSSQSSFSDFGVNDQPVVESSSEQSLRESISRFHIELAKPDEINRTLDAVVQATDLIEQVYLRLTNWTSINNQQRNFVEGLSDFFYNYVWKYPALIISIQTATGPSAKKLKTYQTATLEAFEEELIKETITQKERAHRLDLLPTSDDVKSNEVQNKIFIE